LIDAYCRFRSTNSTRSDTAAMLAARPPTPGGDTSDEGGLDRAIDDVHTSGQDQGPKGARHCGDERGLGWYRVAA
jgi:hypothetical protein